MSKQLLAAPIETTLHKLQTDSTHQQMIDNSWWGGKFSELSSLVQQQRPKTVQHDISQDNLPGETAFLTAIVPDLNPMLIGRENSVRY